MSNGGKHSCWLLWSGVGRERERGREPEWVKPRGKTRERRNNFDVTSVSVLECFGWFVYCQFPCAVRLGWIWCRQHKARLDGARQTRGDAESSGLCRTSACPRVRLRSVVARDGEKDHRKKQCEFKCLGCC